MESRSRARMIDLSVGYASLTLFGASIAVLIWFLMAGVGRGDEADGLITRELERATDGRGDARATFDALLTLAWGFVHSLTARPRVKERLQRFLRPHLMSACYSIVASASLILLCLLFRPIPREIYALEGGAALLVRIVFYAGWALFLYTWMHLDLLEIVGLRPVFRHLDGEPAPASPFNPTGPFLWVRHPVELSFIIIFWAAPAMSAGHLLFASLMTLYTFLGVDLEDRRMLDLHGGVYADYVKRVPQILPLPR